MLVSLYDALVRRFFDNLDVGVPGAETLPRGKILAWLRPLVSWTKKEAETERGLAPESITLDLPVSSQPKALEK